MAQVPIEARAWAEEFNMRAEEKEAIRVKVMQAGRKHSRLADTLEIATSKLQLEWLQRQWSDNEARMRMLKRAMQQEQMGKASVSEILTRVTRKAMGLTKGEGEWDAAERWTASKEAKRRILSQVAGESQHQGGNGGWQAHGWPQQGGLQTTQQPQEYQPTELQGGGK